MGDFLTENWKVVLLAAIGLLAGIAITIRINRKSNKITQNNNKVGGDMAGGDIKKGK